MAGFEENYDIRRSPRAVDSKGRLLILMSPDTLKFSKNLSHDTSGLNGYLCVYSRAGELLKKEVPQHTIRQFIYNEQNRLYALTEYTEDGFRIDLYLHEYDENFQSVDSLYLLTYAPSGIVMSDVGHFDLSFRGDQLVFASRLNGMIYDEDVQFFHNQIDFHGIINCEKGKLSFEHRVFMRDPVDIFSVRQPEIEFLGNETVLLTNKHGNSIYLLRYNYDIDGNPIVDSLELPEGVEQASITQLGSEKNSNRFHLLMFVNDSLYWKGTPVKTNPSSWVILHLDRSFNLLDKTEGFLHRTLNGFGTILLPQKFFYATENELFFTVEFENFFIPTYGYIQLDKDLENLREHYFFSNMRWITLPWERYLRTQLLPYEKGAYLTFPQISWSRTGAHFVNFPNNPSLSDSLGNQSNLLLHHQLTGGYELRVDENCLGHEVSFINYTAEEVDLQWKVDGVKLVDEPGNSIRIQKKEVEPTVVELLVIGVSDTSVLRDSFTSGPFASLNIRPEVDSICQGESLSFRSDVSINRPIIGIAPEYVWEVVRNDTVYLSDTGRSFLKPFPFSGTFNVRHRLTIGNCQTKAIKTRGLHSKPMQDVDITGYPYPACKGQEVTLLPSKKENLLVSFTWANGQVDSHRTTKTLEGTRDTVVMTTISENGCIQNDTAFFQIWDSEQPILDSIVVTNSGEPVLFLSYHSAYHHFLFIPMNRKQDSVDLLWKPSHTDRNSDQTLNPPYRLKAWDACGRAFQEEWTALRLFFDTAGSSLRWNGAPPADSIGLQRLNTTGWETVYTGSGSGELSDLPDGLNRYRLCGYQDGKRRLISNDIRIKLYNKTFFPTAFSPNGDGLNDSLWIYLPEEFVSAQFEIYARNGQLIHLSDDPSRIWDGIRLGEDVPEGNYVIKYRFERRDGSVEQSLHPIQLLR